ncbi:hypothetical protein EYF80_034314 [Liparis tanakae]|uniref:Uncharacterized protein n=1 Tax=Liparis tanakae TaxID=230148 RepID=A0A4Z2GS06_9TELE|nr:hypothetical protein EYF80_034314 [Liparis tanakae]
MFSPFELDVWSNDDLQLISPSVRVWEAEEWRDKRERAGAGAIPTQEANLKNLVVVANAPPPTHITPPTTTTAVTVWRCTSGRGGFSADLSTHAHVRLDRKQSSSPHSALLRGFHFCTQNVSSTLLSHFNPVGSENGRKSVTGRPHGGQEG